MNRGAAKHGATPEKKHDGYGEALRRGTCNEKGFALILALVMMFLMAILGTMIFTASNSELLVSRNYRQKQDTMYAAERAMEYAKSDSNIYNTIGTGTVAVPMAGVSLQVGGTNATGTVEFASNGNPPRGSGIDVTQFQANYYLIDVNGTGQGNSSVDLEGNNAKIIPRP